MSLMRTCELSAVGEFTLVDEEQPTLEDDEVLIRIDRVGICGSDLHYYQNGENGGNVVDFPHVLGHEAAGTVVDVGGDVTDVHESDRVAIEPGLPCGSCPYCTTGAYHLCEDMEYMSSPPVDGALTEYVAWPAEYVYSLPSEVSLREGALVEPLSVAIHACERGGVTPGDSILVTGGGPIGQLVAEVAMARGAETVVLTDVVPHKLELAESRGVDHAVDVTATDPVALIHEQVDEYGVDVVLESSGAPSAVETTTDAVRRGGTVVFIGIPTDPAFPTDITETISREFDLKGSFRFNNTYPEAIEGIRTGRFDVDGIVSFESVFEQTQRAFEEAAAPENVKGVIRVSDES